MISLSGWYSAPLLESMAHGPSGTSNPFSMGLVGNSHIGFHFSLKSKPCHFVKSLYMKAKAGRANHNMAGKVSITWLERYVCKHQNLNHALLLFLTFYPKNKMSHRLDCWLTMLWREIRRYMDHSQLLWE